MGGCIIDTCPVCREFIDEDDDWEVAYLAPLGKDALLHRDCIALAGRDPVAVALIVERDRIHKEAINDKDRQIAFLVEQNRQLNDRLSFFVPRLIENEERKEE